MEDVGDRAQAAVSRTAARPSHGLVWLGRLGLIARGILYLLVGGLAIDVAQGQTGATASQQGAIEAVAGRPFGHALLIAFAIGLAGYAAWRATQALSGREVESGQPRKASDRLSAAASAVAYLAVFGMTIGVLIGSSSSGGGLERFTKWAMGISPWLVGGAGAVLIVIGLYQAIKGLRRSFMKELHRERMSDAARRWVARLGLVGYCARAVSFGLVGYGMMQAARNYKPSQAKGLDGSLQGVLHHRYGSLWVALVAIGLIAFGLESLVESRYRRV